MVNKIIKMSLSDVLSCDDLELLELKAFELDFVIDSQKNKLLSLTNGNDYRDAINNSCKSDKGQILYLLKMKSFNDKFLKKIYSRIKFLKKETQIESKNENQIYRIHDLERALSDRNRTIKTLHKKIKVLEGEIEKIQGNEYLISLVTSSSYQQLEIND
jgi:hypothetical protein